MIKGKKSPNKVTQLELLRLDKRTPSLIRYITAYCVYSSAARH